MSVDPKLIQRQIDERSAASAERFMADAKAAGFSENEATLLTRLGLHVCAQLTGISRRLFVTEDKQQAAMDFAVRFVNEAHAQSRADDETYGREHAAAAMQAINAAPPDAEGKDWPNG